MRGRVVAVVIAVVGLLLCCGGPGMVRLSGMTCRELERAGVLNVALYDCDGDGRVYRVEGGGG